MIPKDWTLLVIAAAGGKSVSPVQLQKTLFLLSRNLSAKDLQVDRLYSFEPYDYGPFDYAVYHDAEKLEAEEQVTIDQAGSRFRSYRATSTGLEQASRLRAKLSPITTGYLDKIVGWVSNLTFNQLIEAIYKAYPEMAKNSVFRR